MHENGVTVCSVAQNQSLHGMQADVGSCRLLSPAMQQRDRGSVAVRPAYPLLWYPLSFLIAWDHLTPEKDWMATHAAKI